MKATSQSTEVAAISIRKEGKKQMEKDLKAIKDDIKKIKITLDAIEKFLDNQKSQIEDILDIAKSLSE